MTYEKAKARFESIVRKMQEDLKADSEKPWLTEAAKDYRISQINGLVEFYDWAEAVEKNFLDQNNIASKRLFGVLPDVEKLVIFCKLHGLNPNMVFGYTLSELREMYEELDMRFYQTGTSSTGTDLQNITLPELENYPDTKSFIKDIPRLSRKDWFTDKYFRMLQKYSPKLRS